MNEGFDPRTLTVVISILATLNGTVLCNYAKTHQSFKGFWQIGIGVLLMAVGFFLISFRPYISNWLTIVSSGFFVVLSITLIGTGVLRFFSFPAINYQKACYLLLALQLVVYVNFTIFEFNPEWRISVICSIFSIQCFYLSYKIKSINSITSKRLVNLLYGAYVLFGLSFLLRVVWTVCFYNEASLEANEIAFVTTLYTFLAILMVTTYIVILTASERLQQDLKVQATTDPLTKLYNRRALESMVSNEFSRSQREQSPFSVALFDVDHFKRVNDLYGHQIGDQVLARLSRISLDNLRAYDILARYGGEEFVIVMPNTRLESAIASCEKLRSIISETSFEFSKLTLSEPITISFGVTECDLNSDSWDRLLSKADKALYQAKQGGRNCVVAFVDS